MEVQNEETNVLDWHALFYNNTKQNELIAMYILILNV